MDGSLHNSQRVKPRKISPFTILSPSRAALVCVFVCVSCLCVLSAFIVCVSCLFFLSAFIVCVSCLFFLSEKSPPFLYSLLPAASMTLEPAIGRSLIAIRTILHKSHLHYFAVTKAFTHPRVILLGRLGRYLPIRGCW